MTNNKINLLLITASVLALAACSPDNQSEQNQNREQASAASDLASDRGHDDHAEGEEHSDAEDLGDEDHGDDHSDDDGHEEGSDHEDGADRADENDHADEDEHSESVEVHLNANQISELGIVVSAVTNGAVDGILELPAEVGFDQNHLAHVTPRVSGIVRSVAVAEGDRVEAGDVLAVLNSRPLADAKASYLSARARLDLAESSFEREERLWERQISAEQDFLDARRALEEARIEVRSAGQQLDALGVDVSTLPRMVASSDVSLTRYELAAPISGTIIERHAVLGEVLEEGAQPPAFIVADTDSVWVDAAVYGADLGRIRAGAPVSIDPGDGGQPIESSIDFVSPQIGERTRTGRARIVIDNPGDRLRPGMFVTVFAAASDAQPTVRVPVTALQTVEGETVVFVRTSDGFEVREVRLGRRSDRYAEILSGVSLGEMIATTQSFSLKAELQKGEFDDGHAH
ncbi:MULTISPECIES: efflux RND transporter periplasmic adaptor subunit [Maricaulis]|jgi:membrane fusion protein, heavy metal efflux system|uniref:Cobalt-zinc-cadmium efflux system membrane fusion protein n=1 Tax=Maricaulis maris TaxID=74318 RepID=A0A495CY86_9PROT|nr:MULTISPECIES: efflux RND transporter periplasmic adaptor subunit [Maricaulis]MAC88552.1 efflux RND transporter periplasmic adaptor subunit [Maricaulis sp.]RKQ94266.1 cobalt-zinc-cadmium efflux system membrane fusion protein [Maricaulis maris]